MYYFIEPKYFGKREIYITPNENIWTPNICTMCGGNNVITSVPASIEIKGIPCDFYENSGKLFISSKCLEAFRTLELTGYSVLPAQAKSENSVLFSKNLEYYELIIQGKCGYAKDLHHNILPKCDLCGRKFPLKESIAGLCFDNADYDGSSIFAFNNLTNLPIVDDVIKKQLIKFKLSNFKFTAISEMIIM